MTFFLRYGIIVSDNKSEAIEVSEVIDVNKLEKYRENNCIEAKKALGGLPKSLWESYSAFANTFGGIILLGVEELGDRSLHAVGIDDPVYMLEQIWAILGDTRRVSCNILTEQDVQIETVSGKKIVFINVPRAHRKDKPVYIGGDPFTGTYRRNGDGDYHCTKEQVQAMLNYSAMLSGMKNNGKSSIGRPSLAESYDAKRIMTIEYLMDFAYCKAEDIALLLRISLSDSVSILSSLVSEGIAVSEEKDGTKKYRLR